MYWRIIPVNFVDLIAKYTCILIRGKLTLVMQKAKKKKLNSSLTYCD